jgi:F-type H+-transporting ATPase subunit delta
MLNKSVARRYAEAFFSIAREAKQVDEFELELDKVMEIIEGTENLKDYLAHLLIPAKAKKEVIGKIFAGNISQVTLNFLMMIIDKRREAYIPVIVEEYKELADEARNIMKAQLISAQEVSADEMKVLAEKLSVSTGKTVQLQQTVDPALIGGIKIRMQDQIIDATVAKRNGNTVYKRHHYHCRCGFVRQMDVQRRWRWRKQHSHNSANADIQSGCKCGKWY